MFMVYKAPDVKLIKIKYDSSVMEIFCREIPRQTTFFSPDSYFTSFTLLCFVSQILTQIALISTLHIWLYVPVDFEQDIFLSLFYFFPNCFSNENHLRYLVIYVT